MTNGSTHWTFYQSGSTFSNHLTALFCRRCLGMALPQVDQFQQIRITSRGLVTPSFLLNDKVCILALSSKSPWPSQSAEQQRLSVLLPSRLKFGNISIWFFFQILRDHKQCQIFFFSQRAVHSHSSPRQSCQDHNLFILLTSREDDIGRVRERYWMSGGKFTAPAPFTMLHLIRLAWVWRRLPCCNYPWRVTPPH